VGKGEGNQVIDQKLAAKEKLLGILEGKGISESREQRLEGQW
jgi:hypothetical protein